MQGWVAYMPLRGGSKSIPRKNIRPLAGRPLFSWSLAAALSSQCFGQVWAGTDSDEIQRAVEHQFGGQVRVFRRSPETCADDSSTESALLEFAAAVDFDVLCTVQATSPLSRAQDFQLAQRAFLQRPADSLLTATRVKRFYWTPDGQPLNYDPARRPRRQDFAGSLMENGAFYLTSRKILDATRCRLGGVVAIHEMAPDSAIEIDEPEDWVAVEQLLLQRDAAAGG
jgi:CMP-N-acetylneuraminic acid synthetase